MDPNQPRLNKPKNDEAHIASAGRTEVHSFSDGCDCAASDNVVSSRKAFETMRANLAMRGFELHIVDDAEGGIDYLVRRWSMSRTLPDMVTVQAFAERAGVRP